jgi:hypothetical protein
VSNTATTGTSGSRSRTSSMTAIAAGLCSGASSESARIRSSTALSINAGAPNSDAPCTTRHPTASSGPHLSMTVPVAAAIRSIVTPSMVFPARRVGARVSSPAPSVENTAHFNVELPGFRTRILTLSVARSSRARPADHRRARGCTRCGRRACPACPVSDVRSAR